MDFREFMRDRVAQVLAGWGVFTIVVYLVAFFFSGGADWGWELTYLPYDGAVVISSIVLLFVAKFYGVKSFEGRVWTIIAAGVGLWMLSEVIWGIDIVVYVLGYEGLPTAISGLTDPIFLTGYIVLACGFYYKMKYTKLHADWTKIGTIAAVTALFALVATYVVTLPLLDSADFTDSDKFYLIAYVIGDIVLFNAGLIVALYWGAEVSKGWYIISAGLLFMMIADVGYTALGIRGIYFDGSFIELAWVAAYLLIGTAGWYQKKLHESFM